jgi:hypothetical protein
VTIDLKSLTVKDSLNSDVWAEDGKLRPEIRERLLEIAEDFYEELDIPWAELEDVKFTGSLANYNWSKYSDIDLHLIVDYTLVDENEDFVEAYFNARKNLWNNSHDITIHGFDVEVYVEDNEAVHYASGMYSVMNDEWIVEPEPTKPAIDKEAITQKSRVFMRLFDDLVQDKIDEKDYSGAVEAAEALSEKLKKFRQCGLEAGGEFSVENLTYKILRRNGTLDKLWDVKIEAYDAMMSID